ncbi:hypothetical protein ACCQ08_24930 [Comamonas sp. SY3]|uniref:hypothetical protein n=1 Tax=Comamonas sp. SY3 TaxID=3243601 RepID=UPI0035933F34
MAKISVNKLAELLVTSNPSRRRKIVQDQKYPSTSVVARYRLAQAPIAAFLRGGRDPQIINTAIATLRAPFDGTEWTLDDRWNTADALERFLEVADSLPSSKDEKYTQGDTSAPKLNIAGVDVSVRPDLLIKFTNRGAEYTGAVKFHFIKNPDSALTHAGSEYVSVLMHRWLEEFGPDGSKPSHAHCICIDVFRGSMVTAPKSTTRRMTEVTAACEEVAARWQVL